MIQHPVLRRFAVPILLIGGTACNGESPSGSASATAGSTGITSASASATTGDPDPTTTTGDEDRASTGTGADVTSTTTEATTGDATSSSTSDTDTEGSSGDPGGPPFCGDGEVDPGEECDDGQDNGPGGACKADCVLDVCGDGDVGPSELCDEGTANGPQGGCSETCTINPSACGQQAYEAQSELMPVDIIVIIDNSGSMGDEIDGVQKNINENFAQIIEQSGLDYRVIMISRHGKLTDESVCIEAPLSGIPQGGCQDPPPEPVHVEGKFYHYSVEVSSHDSLCLLASTFDGTSPDFYGQNPKGWQVWLREEAVKVFVAITDDNVSCIQDGVVLNDVYTIDGGKATANKWDELIRGLSPSHFGATPETRNYRFYSIVGLSYNQPKSEPWLAYQPILTSKCPTAASSGTGYQGLSNLSEVLRFPLCDTTSYDQIFQSIAGGVIKWAKVVCEFPVPLPPMGETLDVDSIEVEYTPGEMGMPVLFDKVPSLDQCTPTGFYIDGGTVHLCPDTCAWVQKDKAASIQVHYTCEPIDPG